MRDDTAEAFLSTGSAVIAHPVSHLIAPVIAGVQHLIDDPQRDTWAQFVPRPDAEPNDHDDGLIRRNGNLNESYAMDAKWFFHYRETLAHTLLMRGVDIRPHIELLDACATLYTSCRSLATSVCEALDRARPGRHIARRHELVAPTLDVLRILRYDRNNGGLIGKPHTDRDFFTIHIADSRPGLRIGNVRQPFATTPDHVLIFPGQKMERMTEGLIKATPHDIIDTGTPNDPERWSLVYFAHID